MNLLNHVAIIMDGNGRWGLKNKRSRNEGHKAGLKTVEKNIKGSNKQKINYKYDTNVNTNLKSKNLESDNNIKAITLSTNTDFGRPLYIDSYTIIFVS